MTIELDEGAEDQINAADRMELAARITRPRAVRILEMLTEARELIIQTHPEPETVRAIYNSEWLSEVAHTQPEIIDPKGTIRFLQKLDGLFAELGVGEQEAGGE